MLVQKKYCGMTRDDRARDRDSNHLCGARISILIGILFVCSSFKFWIHTQKRFHSANQKFGHPPPPIYGDIPGILNQGKTRKDSGWSIRPI